MLDPRLIRAKQDELTRADYDLALEELTSAETDADRYTLLNIVGLGGESWGIAAQHREVVESYLESNDDMLAALALTTLCRRWGLGVEYAASIREWLSVGDDLARQETKRLAALSCAGGIVESRADADVLAALIDVARNSDESVAMRQAASESIAQIAGIALPDWIRIEREGAPALDRAIAQAERRLRPASGPARTPTSPP